MKLSRDFYNRDTLIVAKELLGKILVTDINGIRLSGRIVETEAYKGLEDKAAHTYGGRKTDRVKPMYGIPGKSYVYFVYGSCFCFNVVTREEGVGQAVLIRAIEPLEGIEQMSINRFNKSLEELTKYQSKNLTNGPGKLCSALKIDKSLNDKDLLENEIYIEDSNYKDFKIKEAKRVGIDYAEEAKDYLWRFYIEGNKYVSKK